MFFCYFFVFGVFPRDLKDAHIPLASLLISIRNSIVNALDEEAHIPLESLLISIRNSIENALEEEAPIPL